MSGVAAIHIQWSTSSVDSPFYYMVVLLLYPSSGYVEQLEHGLLPLISWEIWMIVRALRVNPFIYPSNRVRPCPFSTLYRSNQSIFQTNDECEMTQFSLGNVGWWTLLVFFHFDLFIDGKNSVFFPTLHVLNSSDRSWYCRRDGTIEGLGSMTQVYI